MFWASKQKEVCYLIANSGISPFSISCLSRLGKCPLLKIGFKKYKKKKKKEKFVLRSIQGIM